MDQRKSKRSRILAATLVLGLALVFMALAKTEVVEPNGEVAERSLLGVTIARLGYGGVGIAMADAAPRITASPALETHQPTESRAMDRPDHRPDPDHHDPDPPSP